MALSPSDPFRRADSLGRERPARSKRSRNVRLTTMTAMASGAALVSGCEQAPDQDQGAPTQVRAYSSVADCMALGKLSEKECTAAESQARLASDKEAPRFEGSANCEEVYGQGQCVPRSAGGQSFFTPLITGFMIGQMMNGGGYRYAPLYRQQGDDGYRTGSGYRLGAGNSAGQYTTGSRALEEPRAAPRMQSRASVISRGGFGGRSGSSWGG